MDAAGRGQARLPHRRRDRQHLKAMYEQDGNAEMARRFEGFEWKTEEDAFNDGFRHPASQARPIDSQGGGTGDLVTYERLRAMGNNGVQLPIKEYKDGKLIGTEMLYTDDKFDTNDGKAHFLPSPWNGLAQAPSQTQEGQASVLDQQRSNQRSLANGLPRQYNIAFRRDRYPMSPHRDESGGCKGAGRRRRRHRRSLQRLRLDLRDGLSGARHRRPARPS